MVPRVLQVDSKLFKGGAETFIMNLYRKIDRNKIQFDFLVFHTDREYYEEEIERLGGRIFHVPVMEGINLLRGQQLINAFFQHSKDNYLAVHGHMSALGNMYLGAAKNAGIPVRIAHSHIAGDTPGFRGHIKGLFDSTFRNNATHLFACSDLAGKYMFGGSPYRVARNAIDTNCYAYDCESRKYFREKYHISSLTPVLGAVGRFEPQKNFQRLVQMFSVYSHIMPEAKLLIAGEGSQVNSILGLIKAKGLEKNVILLGVLNNMPMFYSAIDALIMPSLYEGLPFTAIEAQSAGLPCLLSDAITNEVSITNLVKYHSLNESDESWGYQINNMLNMQVDRSKYSGIVASSGYDVKTVANYFQNFYLSGGEV